MKGKGNRGFKPMTRILLIQVKGGFTWDIEKAELNSGFFDSDGDHFSPPSLRMTSKKIWLKAKS